MQRWTRWGWVLQGIALQDWALQDWVFQTKLCKTELRKMHWDTLRITLSNTPKHWDTPWITYLTRFWAFRSTEASCESLILRGLEHFEASKHAAANHALYEVLKISKHGQMLRIKYFTRFRPLRSIKTRQESYILRGSEHFETRKHAATDVSTRFRPLRSTEACCESCILQGLKHVEELKHAANQVFYKD